MKKVRFSLVVAAIVVLGGLLTASALAAAQGTQKSIAFSGKYAGQAASKVDGNTASISANGKGSGSLIGSGSITGSGSADASQQPCPPFGGTGTIKGAKGTILFSVVSGSKGCGDEGGHVFSLVGYLSVTKATGALAKAKGKLRFTGTYDRDAGTFSIKLTGTLKK